ncbi:excinuclease ABC subunit UvrA [Anabaena cylindrica FACHB-243]|uniref:UvrABC system protein A n=1 Tax=Anabaena cylindrica (strain ATCC 27899 / PCC 7122) TaxID=272123 RepID=K9ZGY4_ANACC|nr:MULTISPECIES: excinuclease ABC subunit UvrA [Anabaena]AFZ57812.1 Excinuclease ABC subunit A [Anabaena cylindrica PCC 7122]MBD2419278.1 excinuclease ABC subunit UvrA [Anabaena cylindrica FACHB-243]MBY5284704.1 excinuclease ABC subunit UvrA [Anabaena sp. CCAP 1446/1C]MBY5308380.1 excinuclease ABC subunit UvrA [Anabaena sp. CCAP 1446/1C]MCM2408120.1 excinuclease ABC subunit UvrA [Anabaena sp. CCAP 1446/1C]
MSENLAASLNGSLPYHHNSQNTIRIRGARQHNLKNIDLVLPRDRLIVFTGVSGSGKSSLAFDTIFAEGQRRYVESLSAYARQFLGQLDKPDVEAIEGLSPAISIDQKSTSHNPRSTVGTVTEIYDYLRLLYGRAGEPHCPICDRCIAPQTIDQMCDRIMELSDRTRFQILAPVVRGKKGTHRKLLSGLAAQGFVRVRVNGEVRELSDFIELDKNITHTIELVIDRLVKKDGIQERLVDSLSTCLKQSNGIAIIEVLDDTSNKVALERPDSKYIATPGENQDISAQESSLEMVFSENFACPEHGAVMEELSPRLFSFNSPYGACPHCHGIGTLKRFSSDLVIPNPDSPMYAAIAPWSEKENSYYLELLYSLGQTYGFELQTQWSKLTPEQQQIVLYGEEKPKRANSSPEATAEKQKAPNFKGVIPILQRQYEGGSELVKQKLEEYLIDQPCEVCGGKRLKPEALAVKLGQFGILDLTGVSIRDCRERIENLKLSDRQTQIGDLVLREIKARLQFLLDVGLDYLTLDRPAMTLSGGEAQRIRLATQIGSGLTGVLYVLDEPSIGLHQRDNGRLLKTLTKLRDLGNTLIVVEHDEETIRAANYIVDIGPGAGIHGGHIVAQGDLEALLTAEDSLTGAYLSGRRVINTPAKRREGNGRSLTIKNASRNNLQNIDVEIPLGKLVSVTGVSGSGKSTLINELLYPALQHHLLKKAPLPKDIDEIKGLNSVDKAIVIDQSPIGRTPRSNPATYTGVFDIIRDVFSQTIEAKTRGYKPGQFSFNVKGGRCEACSGQGVNVIEMNFLPDVYVQCEICKGARYNRETLQVKYKDKSISDVLNMTVEEALDFCQNIPKAVTRLQTLVDVGLGYVQLGQPATTLSGGEAQRVKLATELSRRATGKTLYLIDEPTTGLSFYDVHKLLDVLQRLVDKGNSILVIEHNLDVIRCSDWVIDLGPEGGDKGGEIIAAGTPEDVAKNDRSYTGQYLQQVLKQYPVVA